ncbi:MAG TPA: hypothetical protein VGD67_08215 [Pseudonocardiaceae bacterium]
MTDHVQWTGYDAQQLRRALRMSQRAFATHLGLADRTITRWEKLGRETTPFPETQAILDTALARATDDVRARFRALLELDFTEDVQHGRPANSDGAALAEFEERTEDMRVRYHQAPASELLPVALAHLEVLQDALRGHGADRRRRELGAMAQETAGLVAWLRHDCGLDRLADQAYTTAQALLKVSGDRALAGYVSTFRAEAALHQDDLDGAAAYFSAARSMVGRGAPWLVEAWTSAVGAEVMAVTARPSDAVRLLGAAETALDKAGGRPGAPWMYRFDESRLALYRGRTLLALGEPAAARREFDAALAVIPPLRIRRRSEAILGSARADLAVGSLSDAHDGCVSALSGFVHTRSTRGLRQVRSIRDELKARGAALLAASLDDRMWDLVTAGP